MSPQRRPGHTAPRGIPGDTCTGQTRGHTWRHSDTGSPAHTRGPTSRAHKLEIRVTETSLWVISLTFRAVLATETLVTVARIRAHTRSLMTRVTADGETRGLVLAPSIAVTARVNHTLLVLKLNIM